MTRTPGDAHVSDPGVMNSSYSSSWCSPSSAPLFIISAYSNAIRHLFFPAFLQSVRLVSSSPTSCWGHLLPRLSEVHPLLYEGNLDRCKVPFGSRRPGRTERERERESRDRAAGQRGPLRGGLFAGQKKKKSRDEDSFDSSLTRLW